jgi:hypothetical protein
VNETQVKSSEKLPNLAGQLSYANGVKEAARIRRQCTLDEWQIVLREARKIYHIRFAKA